ncbi:curculin (mannose-binding) lectin protein [Aeromonas veronii bv. sobria]|uniref:curculin (mannose-binding) lectin protein n=1 Tax=Aeromonas veronii TaxID=654 RepID=UPI0035BFC7AB
MTILSGDIVLLASQRLVDTDDGGGRITGREIISGNHNSLFPDVSDMDRAYGTVNMRKAFLAVQTDDTDTYYGANAMVLLPPSDPSVNLTLMTTKDHNDTRDNARNTLERYQARGPKWQGVLYDTQLEGQRAIRILQRIEVRLPEVGEVLVLVGNEGKGNEVEQYVRVDRVTAELRKFGVAGYQGEFTRNVVTCVITDPLRHTFEGEQPSPYDQATTKTTLRETVVADAANYFSTTKLVADAALGAMRVQAKTIFTQLVPSARSETPVVDLTAAGELGALLESGVGSPHTFTTTSPVSPSQGLFLGIGAMPGSVSVTIGAAVITDKGGELFLVGTVVGAIDYGRGLLTFNSQCPNYGAASKTVSFRPAVMPSRIADTAQIQIAANNRGYAYTATLLPTPCPGSLTVSYLAQGKWYDLKDNGRGELFGQDKSYGSGLLNFTTGSVVLTLGALPDVNSSIMFSWGTKVSYLNRASMVLDPVQLAHKLAHEGITPNSLTLTWQAGGATKTAIDNGAGQLTGDATGTINYVTGDLALRVATLPDGGQEYQVVYQYGNPDIQRFDYPARNPDGTITMQLAKQNLTPRMVSVRWNALYEDVKDDTELVIATRDPIISVRDNGAGKLLDAAGVERGTVNYTTGQITIKPDGQGGIPKTRYEWRTIGTYGDGHGNTIARQRWTLVEIYYVQAAYLFPVDDSGWVEVEYRSNNASSAGQDTVKATPLVLDITPRNGEAILANSVRFALGGSVYVDRQGILYRNIDPATGAGEQAGTLDYATGKATITVWNPGAAPIPALSSLVTSLVAQTVDEVTFRTPGAPIAPSSLYLSGNTADGRRFEVTANGDGTITSTDVSGKVDYQTGVVSVRFGRLVTAAGNEGKPWYDPDMVVDGKIWRPLSVVADTIRFNAVVYSYLPLDADLIKLDPVRLPSDGRVPFIRKGYIVVVHSTKRSAFPMGVQAGQQLNTGRERLAYCRVEDKNGKELAPQLYSVNMNSGVVTLASPLSLTGYVEPLTVVHRVEDMSLATDVEISGRITLARPLSHSYEAADTLVASALIIGDLWARYGVLFDQRTWTNNWSDFLIGDPCTAEYNDTDFPIVVTNRATLQERWAIIFQTSTTFILVGEHVGQIAVGDVNTDFAPINPNNGQPYFRLDRRGWGAGWAAGNVLRFNTYAANYPIWFIRTILQSVAAVDTDRFEAQLRGNVNR